MRQNREGWLGATSKVVTFLGCFALISQAGAEVSLVGSWINQPELSQLGNVQTTLTFRADGSYSQKVDHQSFCGMNAIQPDCVYFWMVIDGSYVTSGTELSLRQENMHDVTLLIGEKEPKTRDQGKCRFEACNRPETFTYEIRGTTLLLTDTQKGRMQTFTREKAKGE